MISNFRSARYTSLNRIKVRSFLLIKPSVEIHTEALRCRFFRNIHLFALFGFFTKRLNNFDKSLTVPMRVMHDKKGFQWKPFCFQNHEMSKKTQYLSSK